MMILQTIQSPLQFCSHGHHMRAAETIFCSSVSQTCGVQCVLRHKRKSFLTPIDFYPTGSNNWQAAGSKHLKATRETIAIQLIRPFPDSKCNFVASGSALICMWDFLPNNRKSSVSLILHSGKSYEGGGYYLPFVS